MGELSPEARRAIDEALRRIPPEERRVPRGASGLPGYVWDARTRTIVCRDPARRGSNAFRYGQGWGRRPLTDERRIAIIADLRAGLTHAEIARSRAVGERVIHKIAAEHGLTRRARVDADAIAEGIGRGLTVSELTRAHGCGATTVRRIAAQRSLVLASAAPAVVSEPSAQSGVRLARSEVLTVRITELADGRRSVSEIARLAGCDRDAVRLRRDRLGLDIPAGRPGPTGGPRKGRSGKAGS